MTFSLTNEQIMTLLEPIKPHRVLIANGQSHVPAYDVAAHLTRIFGFGGWTKEILTLTLINEEPVQLSNGRKGWTVTYSATLRLTVRDGNGETAWWEDGACGTSTLPQRGEAHDMALKSAISYALKRCAAFGLGDQFGLSLYNKGQTSALVGKLVGMGDVQAAAPTALSLGNDERDDAFQEPAVELAEAFRSMKYSRGEVFNFVKTHTPVPDPSWNGELSSLSDVEINHLLKELAIEAAGSEGLDAAGNW